MSILPWPWTRKFSLGAWFILDAEGTHICLVNRDTSTAERIDDTTIMTKTLESPHANGTAALIAAAPELLEALQIILVQFGEYKDGDGAAKFHAINAANAAILKATVPL